MSKLWARRGCLQPAGHAQAARRVRLQDVDCARLEHVPEVPGVEAVLTGGDRLWNAAAHERETLEIIGRDRLLEVADALLRELLGQANRLLDGVGAVGVDEQLRVGTDRLARHPHPLDVDRWPGAPIGADLHLDARDSLLDPAAELLGELRVRVGGEAAAAVDRHRSRRAPRRTNSG